MKRLFIIALAVGVLCVLLAGLSSADEAKKATKAEVKESKVPAGQKVFTEAKCQMCHTVFSSGIGEPPAEDAEDEGDGPPDLSLTGAGRTSEWMSLFLQKKETLDDKKHMKKFKGSDEDLTALVDWLMTLKPAEKKAAPKAEKAAGAEAAKATESAEGEKGKVHEGHETHESKEAHESHDDGDHGEDHDDHKAAHDDHEEAHDDHDNDDDDTGAEKGK